MEEASERPEWMAIGQAAKYLGISRDTLRRWEKRGKLETIRSPTNRRFYTRKQLDKLLLGEKEENPRSQKAITPNTQKLILFAVLSFLVAVIFALFFFLR